MAFSHDEGTVAVHGDACLFLHPEKIKENQKNAFEKLTQIVNSFDCREWASVVLD